MVIGAEYYEYQIWPKDETQTWYGLYGANPPIRRLKRKVMMSLRKTSEEVGDVNTPPEKVETAGIFCGNSSGARDEYGFREEVPSQPKVQKASKIEMNTQAKKSTKKKTKKVKKAKKKSKKSKGLSQ